MNKQERQQTYIFKLKEINDCKYQDMMSKLTEEPED